jgi:endonuclease/exonuclease/phosphatase family metal-dependent hydrolase
VFVTHLEAREPAIRPSQYAEFAQFLKQHSSPERPAVLMGDFNTRGGQEEMSDARSAYNQMTKGFQQARPESVLIDLWPAIGQGPGGTSDQSDQDGGRRIDYIFALNPKSGSPQLKPRSVQVNRFLDPQVVALSDHSAVESLFDWLP